MAYGTRVAFEVLREVAFGSITSSYVALGNPIANPIRLISFINDTDTDIYVSLDGTNDHLRFANTTFQLFDFSSNKIRNDGFYLPVGTQIYVKDNGTGAASGNFWVEAIYAEGGV